MALEQALWFYEEYVCSGEEVERLEMKAREGIMTELDERARELENWGVEVLSGHLEGVFNDLKERRRSEKN